VETIRPEHPVRFGFEDRVEQVGEVDDGSARPHDLLELGSGEPPAQKPGQPAQRWPEAGQHPEIRAGSDHYLATRLTEPANGRAQLASRLAMVGQLGDVIAADDDDCEVGP
jgi:hypothetical protein